MADNLSFQDRKKTMRAVKGKRTKLELKLFSMLAGMGINGWQQNVKEIAGKPDVVFFEQRIAIFVDGCFWHGCPICNRKLPKTNQNYWKRKIERNIELAIIYNKKLANEGWTVIRVWEHELNNNEKRAQFRCLISNSIRQET